MMMKKQSKRVCVGEITSGYGIRKHPITRKPGSIHNGVDIACPEGTAIYSPVLAKVMSVYYHEKGGLTAILKDLANNDRYGFCHLQEVVFPVGATVNKAELLARSGNTGKSTGPHLHYSYATSCVWLQDVCVRLKYEDPTSKIEISE